MVCIMWYDLGCTYNISCNAHQLQMNPTRRCAMTVKSPLGHPAVVRTRRAVHRLTAYSFLLRLEGSTVLLLLGQDRAATLDIVDF